MYEAWEAMKKYKTTSFSLNPAANSSYLDALGMPRLIFKLLGITKEALMTNRLSFELEN